MEDRAFESSLYNQIIFTIHLWNSQHIHKTNQWYCWMRIYAMEVDNEPVTHTHSYFPFPFSICITFAKTRWAHFFFLFFFFWCGKLANVITWAVALHFNVIYVLVRLHKPRNRMNFNADSYHIYIYIYTIPFTINILSFI